MTILGSLVWINGTVPKQAARYFVLAVVEFLTKTKMLSPHRVLSGGDSPSLPTRLPLFPWKNLQFCRQERPLLGTAGATGGADRQRSVSQYPGEVDSTGTVDG